MKQQRLMNCQLQLQVNLILDKNSGLFGKKLNPEIAQQDAKELKAVFEFSRLEGGLFF